jgi:DNA-binding MarR family transcriptional regulator
VRAAWWLPRWLDKLLPKVDVEGERLPPRCPDRAGRHPFADRAQHRTLSGLTSVAIPAHTCVVQATVCNKDDDDLASALYAVVLRLSRLPVDEPVDKAGLAVLHETRRLGAVRPSDLAAQMHLDLSTISRHLRSLEKQGMLQRSADPDDARALRISITARGTDVLTRVSNHRATKIRDAIAHWPESDRSTLCQLLRRLAGDLAPVAEPDANLPTHQPARIEQLLEKS